VSEFFEAGKTYTQAKPFRAPESLERFQCVVVADHPAGRGRRAFGFLCTVYPGDNWRSYVLALSAWEDGWTEDRDEEKQ
jgi:hypothetical protein